MGSFSASLYSTNLLIEMKVRIKSSNFITTFLKNKMKNMVELRISSLKKTNITKILLVSEKNILNGNIGGPCISVYE